MDKGKLGTIFLSCPAKPKKLDIFDKGIIRKIDVKGKEENLDL
jgi:hypothetical protein